MKEGDIMWKDILKGRNFGGYSGYAAQLDRAISDRVSEGNGENGKFVKYFYKNYNRGPEIFFNYPGSEGSQFVLSTFARDSERFIKLLGSDGQKYMNDAYAFIVDLQNDDNIAQLFDNMLEKGNIEGDPKGGFKY